MECGIAKGIKNERIQEATQRVRKEGKNVAWNNLKKVKECGMQRRKPQASKKNQRMTGGNL